MKYFLLLLLIIPTVTFAQAGGAESGGEGSENSVIKDAVESTGSELKPIVKGGSGGGDTLEGVKDIVEKMVEFLIFFVPILNVIAILMIIVGGLMMVIIDDESNAAPASG